MRADDFDIVIHASQWADKADDFPDAGVAGFQEAKRDMAAKVWRIAGRGDVSLIVLCLHRVAFGHQMRASGHLVLRVHRLQPHQFQRVGFIQTGALRQFRPDGILGFGHHLAHPKVQCGGRAVQFVRRRVALFDPHDIERLKPVRHHIEFLARLHQPAHQRVAIAGGYGNLVSQFAREGDPEQPCA